MPILNAACILVFAAFIYWKLRLNANPFNGSAQQGAAFVWAASYLCFVAAVALNLCVSAIIIKGAASEDPDNKWQRWLWEIQLAVGIACWPIILLINWAGKAGHTLLAKIESVGIPIEYLTGFGNVWAFSGILAIALSTCVLAGKEANPTVHTLSKNMRLFFLSLYSAAALLVLGLIEIHSLFHWAAVLSTAPALPSPEVYNMASSIVLAAGLCFSLLLVSMYLPVAIRQHRSVADLLAIESQREERFNRKQFLATHNLETSPFKFFTISLAMLAPLASGFLTSISKLFP